MNHSWIFHVFERKNCLSTFAVFLRRNVEFARMTRGQFFMVRDVRHGCPASGFRSHLPLAPAITPRNICLDFLQPLPCAYADEFAVAASSFRRLMTALTRASEVVDDISLLYLNHRKCCWCYMALKVATHFWTEVTTKCEDLIFCVASLWPWTRLAWDSFNQPRGKQ